jgi:hypothetical protein
MSDQSKLGLGKIITTEQNRDAIHVAVAPVEAAIRLRVGAHVGIDREGKATNAIHGSHLVGVVDPFIADSGYVEKGERFWLFLYPGSITSLRHCWEHPAFKEVQVVSTTPEKSASEQWMRDWATQHMGEDYYGDGDKPRSPESAYASAIDAGHNLSVGPYEDARDHIDDEWWTHWENITGQRGQRGGWFSCGC